MAEEFKPSVFHNDEGRQWEIYLTDEPCYVGRETINVEVHRSQETDRVVGFTIHDYAIAGLSNP